MAKKFYAIKQGKKTGIFSGQWSEIQKKYIIGFPTPEYRGFNEREEAERYMGEPLRVRKKRDKKEIRKNQSGNDKKDNELKGERTILNKKLIYSENIEEHRQMPTVNIALLGHQSVHLEERPGYYEYILVDDKSGKHLKVVSELMPHTSQNKAMIDGLMDAISKLKFPCHVRVYVKTHIGFRKMVRGSKSPNADALSLLRERLLDKGHVVQEVFDVEKTVRYFNDYA